MALSRELLDILACPRCKGPLKYDEGAQGLTCETCRLRFSVMDDIPVMILAEAETLED